MGAQGNILADSSAERRGRQIALGDGHRRVKRRDAELYDDRQCSEKDGERAAQGG
jgi:hypothetical protein